MNGTHRKFGTLFLTIVLVVSLAGVAVAVSASSAGGHGEAVASPADDVLESSAQNVEDAGEERSADLDAESDDLVVQRFADTDQEWLQLETTVLEHDDDGSRTR